jgi:hypothetical protein
VSKAVQVQILGVAEVTVALHRFEVRMGDLSDPLDDVAQDVVAAARRLVPVRSGALSGTIRGGGSRKKAWVAAGNRGVVYAGVINYGWRSHGIAPTRFLNRAVDPQEAAAVAQLSTYTQRQIDKAGLR